MQIGSRFTEYGLTGGFFWICQLLFLTYSGQAKALMLYLKTVPFQDIPDRIWQIGSPAISALAIIAVFVAGLLLDLLAVYFRPVEMRVFYQHLVRNRDWLCRLIADHKAYCEADYEEFERQFSEKSLAKDMLTGCLFVFGFWKREIRQQYAAGVKRTWRARPYERLWSFFASYVFVQSGSSQLSLMVDQYYLWRTGRAVSISLVILFVELQLLNYFPSYRSAQPFFLQLFLPLGLSILSIIITREMYSRLCFTLFALLYVTQDKRSAELLKTA
jgi:hypothetical protein